MANEESKTEKAKAWAPAANALLSFAVTVMVGIILSIVSGVQRNLGTTQERATANQSVNKAQTTSIQANTKSLDLLTGSMRELASEEKNLARSIRDLRGETRQEFMYNSKNGHFPTPMKPPKPAPTPQQQQRFPNGFQSGPSNPSSNNSNSNKSQSNG